MDDARRIAPLWIEWPEAKVRRKFSTYRGDVRGFVLQLEYNLTASLDGGSPAEWTPVARFDHNEDGPHDIREEGLHLDVYRDGEKYRRVRNFPAVVPNEAIGFCEQYFKQNADYLLARFERWHNIRGKWAATRPRR